MSLIAWYPLIRDLKNQGLDDNDLIQSNTAITYTSGLYGKSANFNNSVNECLYRPKINQNKNITITGWFKYADTGAQIVLFNCANGQQNNDGWSVWLGYPSHTLYYQFGNVKWNNTNNPTPFNTWFHIAMVVDDNSVYRFYLNGEQMSTGTVTTLPDYSEGDYISLGAFKTSSTVNQSLLGQAQDFRIYDHALSTKEIKELSKGLILHHELKGYGANPNLITKNESYNGEGTPYYVYKNGPSVNTVVYFQSPLMSLEKNTDYTLSFDARLITDNDSLRQFVDRDLYPDSLPQSNILRDENGVCNKWRHYTWTVQSSHNDMENCRVRIFSDNVNSATGNRLDAPIEFKNIKFEKSSKETPFIPSGLYSLDLRTVPTAYTPVEYIEGTGTQYINTGYIHKATTRIDMVCNISLNNAHTDYVALFGSRKETYKYNDFSFYATRNWQYIPCYSRTNAETTDNGLLYDEKILISAYNTTCSWYRYGSTTAVKTITTTGTPDDGFNNMSLFCINKSETADGFTWDRPPAVMKLYSCKIWDDNGTTLVRDFIPALRKSDSKIGLYDAVNDVFYTNAGTGEFLTSSNTVEEDLSGNGYNGTRQGVTFSDDSPRYYMSTEFNADKDLVLNRIFHQNDQVSNLSISIWANFDSLANNLWNLNQNDFIRMRPAGTSSMQVIAKMGSTNTIRDIRLSTGQTIAIKTWYHFVLTFDNGIFKLYVNGINTDTIDKTDIATTLFCVSNNGHWSLGDYTTGSEALTGKLSDFRIYAKTLTADDVKELYNTSATIDKSGKVYCGEFVEE